jgi:hypothetical protein
MMVSLNEIRELVLQLDSRDRAALAEELLASLDEISEEEAGRLWVDEAEKRLADYNAGRAKSYDAASVHEEAMKLYE